MTGRWNLQVVARRRRMLRRLMLALSDAAASVGGLALYASSDRSSALLDGVLAHLGGGPLQDIRHAGLPSRT